MCKGSTYLFLVYVIVIESWQVPPKFYSVIIITWEQELLKLSDLQIGR